MSTEHGSGHAVPRPGSGAGTPATNGATTDKATPGAMKDMPGHEEMTAKPGAKGEATPATTADKSMPEAMRDMPGHEGMTAKPGAKDKATPGAMKDKTAPKTMAGMPAHEGMTADPGMSDMAMTHGLATPPAHFFAAVILGVWLITSPVSLGYHDQAQSWSDIISGILVIAFAAITLVRRSAWAPWANSLIGVWLLFAPLVFWSPTAAGYANDTLVGALVIAFVLLMPGMPGMRMLPGPDTPPGWSYNPSSWPQRAPIIALAFLGFILSRYMAGYQLGYIDSVWDPFFGDGTRRVLTSDVSRGFPISDAGFGAVAYMVEALMGFMGDKQRWRTMPWMVTFFGILVVPLGLVSITLIILQPLAVGEWCTPCLIAAAAMLVMIALTLDEVVAMGQFLVQARREGQPLWRTFWMGGTLQEAPASARVHPDVVSARAMIWGVALPWSLLLSLSIGLWLMLTPSALGSAGAASHSDHLVGALIVATAVIALADVGRALRFINILLGAVVIAAPWILGGATTASTLNGVIAGVLVIVLSLPQGPVGERYGAWERFIRWPRKNHTMNAKLGKGRITS